MIAPLRPEISLGDEPYRNCRWHNYSFIRLPRNAQQWLEAEGRDVPTSLDRPALVGLLEDAGFKLKEPA